MSDFIGPQGISFCFEAELTAIELSGVLCRIASFLQSVEPYVRLRRYDDWWEHDGLHFPRGDVDFNAFFQMIGSPKGLLESTPSDDYVFVGMAPEDNAWYLRYRVEWDEDESNLIGTCAVILPEHLVEKFRIEVLPRIGPQPSEKDSERFYQEIVL
jgi:hypothetical protein